MVDIFAAHSDRKYSFKFDGTTTEISNPMPQRKL
jgi:hypothetical protein